MVQGLDGGLVCLMLHDRSPMTRPNTASLGAAAHRRGSGNDPFNPKSSSPQVNRGPSSSSIKRFWSLEPLSFCILCSLRLRVGSSTVMAINDFFNRICPYRAFSPPFNLADSSYQRDTSTYKILIIKTVFRGRPSLMTLNPLHPSALPVGGVDCAALRGFFATVSSVRRLNESGRIYRRSP